MTPLYQSLLNSPVQKLQRTFDVGKLIDLQRRLWPTPQTRQLCLTHPEGVSGGERYLNGVGSLTKDRSEHEFTKFIEELKGEYLYEVYLQVSEIARAEGVGIGRVRYMLMPPVSCLSYHQDYDQFRFHVPLVTNMKAMFIVDDKVYRMPEVGELYALRTDSFHTIINGHRDQPRLHLVFCTYPLAH